MTEETASKILECGLAGPMIEIALMDGELEEAKESYHITMSGAVFGAWMSNNCVECVVNNGLDGNELSEVLMEMLRTSFVIYSQMVREWTVCDVRTRLKLKLKSVKTLSKNDMSKLLQSLGMIPSKDLRALRIEQTVQSKIRGKYAHKLTV